MRSHSLRPSLHRISTIGFPSTAETLQATTLFDVLKLGPTPSLFPTTLHHFTGSYSPLPTSMHKSNTTSKPRWLISRHHQPLHQIHRWFHSRHSRQKRLNRRLTTPLVNQTFDKTQQRWTPLHHCVSDSHQLNSPLTYFNNASTTTIGLQRYHIWHLNNDGQLVNYSSDQTLQTQVFSLLTDLNTDIMQRISSFWHTGAHEDSLLWPIRSTPNSYEW